MYSDIVHICTQNGFKESSCDAHNNELWSALEYSKQITEQQTINA